MHQFHSLAMQMAQASPWTQRPAQCRPRFPCRRRLVASFSYLRRRVHCRSLDDDADEELDIDALASRLSREAQSRRAHLRTSLDVREPDFDIDDFEIVQTLGYLSVRSSKSRDQEAAAVVAFVARYFSGRPYQYPVLTLLKEYLPSAKAIAENEFGAVMQLAPLPENKWEVRMHPFTEHIRLLDDCLMCMLWMVVGELGMVSMPLKLLEVLSL